MDYFEMAQNELKNDKYRTYAQFMVIMDSAYNGTFSQAAEMYNTYGFCAHSYTEELVNFSDELADDKFLIDGLKDLVVIIELAKNQKIYELERINVDQSIKLNSLN